jgi:TetR/AcrR family transcriptional regulator, transcriptional repressor for nem operon
MRYPDGHKEEVRASIIKNASKALRRDGLSGVSIPALMKKAGLTHGGFYTHFKSRDDLVAAAVLFAAEETGASVLSDEMGDLTATLKAYLSKEHMLHPEEGCVLAALGAEGRHQTAPIRRAFANAARGFLRLVDSKLQKKNRSPEPSEAGIRLAAQMVGAVVLARLVDNEELAVRILTAAQKPN